MRISTSSCAREEIAPYRLVVQAKKQDSLLTSFTHSSYSWHPDLSNHSPLSSHTNFLITQSNFLPFLQFLLPILETSYFSPNCILFCLPLPVSRAFPLLDLPNTFPYSLQRSLSFSLAPGSPSQLSVCDFESLFYSNVLLTHSTKTATAELKT